MFKFLKKKEIKNNNLELLSKTASLLVHAAKIDENYTIKEKELIKKVLIELGVEKSKVYQIITNAEINEEKSNQILDFTKIIKNENKEYKIKIVETLWSIIYSNNEADIYESNLMRRLSGLLYLDDKLMGEIKKKIREQNLK
tara:strand:+ start:321 stop:746 length:426 start_codon:yes stop_codon:yes gene_type:complete